MTTSITGQGITAYKVPDDALSNESKNAVQNKVINGEVTDLQNAISANEDNLVDGNRGIETLEYYDEFANGSLASGVLQPDYEGRVSTVNIISFDRDLVLTIASGFRIGVHSFIGDTFSADSGWMTGTYTIPANTRFKMVISRVSEISGEIANIHEFVSKVTFATIVGAALNSTVGFGDNIVPNNLFVYKKSNPGYIGSNGAIYSPSSAKDRYSDYIEVTAGNKLLIQSFATVGSSEKLGFSVSTYDTQKTFVSRHLNKEGVAGEGYVSELYTVPSDIKYLRISNRFYADGKMMITKGDKIFPYTMAIEDKVSCEEYSNALNIIDALESRNLFAYATTVDGYITSTGTIQHGSAGERTSDYIPVNEGEVYTAYVWGTLSANNRQLSMTFGFYNSSKEFIDRAVKEFAAGDEYGTYSYIVPTGGKYMRVVNRFWSDYPDSRILVLRGTKSLSYTYAWEDIATKREFNDLSDQVEVISHASSTGTGLFNHLLTPAAFRFCAHRGASSVAPENTVPAFQIAASRGNWAIETDVYETTDGYFVLMHDNDVSGMTDGTGNLTSMTYAQTQELTIDAGANIGQYPNLKIPRLEDYLLICKKYGCVPIIEIKGVTNLDKLVETVRGFGMEGGSILTFYRNAEMMSALRILTAMPILLVAMSNTTTVDSLIEMADGYNDIWFSLPTALVNAADVEKCHMLNIPVAGWTYNSMQDINNALEYGVDFVFSDNIYQFPTE